MLAFPPIDPDAVKVLTFDFTQALGAGEVLQGGPIVKSVICTAGTDPNPMNIVLGPPSYDFSGLKILLPVGNLSALIGNDYEIEVVSATNYQPEVIPGRALLQVRIS